MSREFLFKEMLLLGSRETEPARVAQRGMSGCRATERLHQILRVSRRDAAGFLRRGLDPTLDP